MRRFWSQVRASVGRRSSAAMLDLREGDAAARREPRLVAGLRVLLIADARDTGELLAGALRHHGAHVTAVASVDEALAVIERLRPQVVVSHCAMDAAGASALIREVRVLEGQGLRRIPTVALTAYRGARSLCDQVVAGFQVQVRKPVDADELVSILGRLAPAAAGR